MLWTFIITLREGVEAALIVGITLAYLTKIGRPELRKTVYASLAAAFLDVQISEQESRHSARGNPSLAAGEAVFAVISLMTRPFAPITVRADAAITRLSAIPAFLAGVRQWGPVGDGVPGRGAP